jgi:hypothetical protein
VIGNKAASKNANGRLRRWLPRHLDIDRTSGQQIQEIVPAQRFYSRGSALQSLCRSPFSRLVRIWRAMLEKVA